MILQQNEFILKVSCFVRKKHDVLIYHCNRPPCPAGALNILQEMICRETKAQTAFIKRKSENKVYAFHLT